MVKIDLKITKDIVFDFKSLYMNERLEELSSEMDIEEEKLRDMLESTNYSKQAKTLEALQESKTFIVLMAVITIILEVLLLSTANNHSSFITDIGSIFIFITYLITITVFIYRKYLNIG